MNGDDRPLDRRGLTLLGLTHTCADMCQGAVPALLPFLAAERGYSFAALGSLVLAATIGSSLIQPVFGLLSDRVRQSWLMPAGVLLAGLGLAVVGLLDSYELTVAAIAVSGVGVAAFHPEGARFAGIAAGARRGRGMSMFSVGGNVGFALGPLLTTPLVLLFGLPGTLGLVVLPAIMAVVLLRGLPHLHQLEAVRKAAVAASGIRRVDQWGAFSVLSSIVAIRSGVYFGLQAFVPLWFVTQLGTGEGTGNAALTAMLVAGAVGTLIGGQLVDTIGPRKVLVGSIVASLPLLLVFPLVGPTAGFAVLTAIGLVIIASFSVTVVLGQQYLPNRPGLASGVTLGLAIGMGGLVATILGVVADAHGLETVLWILACLPVPAALLSFLLPRESGERSGAPARFVAALPDSRG
ncbi:MAG TPA: MFS transporter [Thermoleophilaceae bacterium]|nr:MFS transporter [Thermoleophilaceae bacterium]